MKKSETRENKVEIDRYTNLFMVQSVMSASMQTRGTMNGGPAAHLDDQRAYQLALELSMLGLGNNNSGNSNSNVGNQYHQQPCMSSHQNYDGYRDEHGDQQHHDPYYQSDNHYNTHNMGNPLIEPPYDDPMFGNAAGRKSANMTETVPVPSSEHVAEIVGRQGCKIKALRAKTNTYIKTPVRGAEPVFVVTGRQEDVGQAKQEILSAADHFSQIRASRRNGSAGSQASNSSGTASPTSTPGHVTLQVRVPYKVVGLVVGPKGATIKRIQQMTSTYIVTPGRDKEPVFEVTGLPDSVEKAKEEIEKHIASRTGTDNNSDLQIDDFNINGIDSGFHDQSGDSTTNHYNGTNNYSNNIVNQHDNLPPLSSLNGMSHHHKHHYKPSQLNQPSSSSHLNTNIKISEFALPPQYTNYAPGGFNRAPDYEVDEGIGTSGGSIFDPSAIWSDASYGVQRSHSISVTSSRILPPGEDGPHPRTRRTNSDPLAAAFQRIDAAFSSSSPTSSQGSMSPVTGRRNASPPRPKQQTPRDCLLCGGDVNAALVPCGHNSFCMGCANEICRREAERRLCPICHEVPSQAILIRNC